MLTSQWSKDILGLRSWTEISCDIVISLNTDLNNKDSLGWTPYLN